MATSWKVPCYNTWWMGGMSPKYNRLLGEAVQMQFAPECLCFIFKCTDDYYWFPECHIRPYPVSEGVFLRTVIKPLYRFIRDQVDGKFVRRKKLTSSSGMQKALQVLCSMTRFILVSFSACFWEEAKSLADTPCWSPNYTLIHWINWSHMFFEGQSEISLISIEFFVIHIVLYYFYTAYNSMVIYKAQGQNSQVKTWSAATLDGAVAMAWHFSSTSSSCIQSNGRILSRTPFAHDENLKGQTKANDLPFYFIGFNTWSAAPEFTFRIPFLVMGSLTIEIMLTVMDLRQPIYFNILFSCFAGPSIYLGMRTLIMLLYMTLTFWTPHLITQFISGFPFLPSLCTLLVQPSPVCLYCIFSWSTSLLIWPLAGKSWNGCVGVTCAPITTLGLDIATYLERWLQATRRNWVTHPLRWCFPCWLANSHLVRNLPHIPGCSVCHCLYVCEVIPRLEQQIPAKSIDPHCSHFHWAYCLECHHT